MRRTEMRLRCFIFDQRQKVGTVAMLAGATLTGIASRLTPDPDALSERDREALSWRNCEGHSQKVITAQEWVEVKKQMYQVQQEQQEKPNASRIRPREHPKAKPRSTDKDAA